VSRKLQEHYPDSGVLIRVQREDLAGYILEHLHAISESGLSHASSHNIANEISRSYVTFNEKIYDAIYSACQWLIKNDFLEVRNDGGFFRFSPKGNEIKTINEFHAYLTGEAGNNMPSAHGLGTDPPTIKDPASIFSGSRTPVHGVDVAAKYVFLDIVGFTRNRKAEAQADIVTELNKIVRKAVKSQNIPDDKIIFIPTGDGICIVLLSIEHPLDVHMQIALNILEYIDAYNASTQDTARQFQVRIGINAHPDILVTDINNRQNIAGVGISTTFRIMGLADEGQIIVGQSVYSALQSREKYDSAFRSYRATVKHGDVLDVYQFIKQGHKGLNTNQLRISEPAKAEHLISSQTVLMEEEKAKRTKPDITGKIKGVYSEWWANAKPGDDGHVCFDYHFAVNTFVTNRGAKTTIEQFKLVLKAKERSYEGVREKEAHDVKENEINWRAWGADELGDLEKSNDELLEYSRNGWLWFVVFCVGNVENKAEMEIELYAVDKDGISYKLDISPQPQWQRNPFREKEMMAAERARMRAQW
jgi:class 3 adenylate cyclase